MDQAYPESPFLQRGLIQADEAMQVPTDAWYRGSGRQRVAEILDVTDSTFEAEVLEHPIPAIVDFWGDHCPACRQISPILRELAETYAGRIRVLKVHAAENPAVSARCGVRAMPTVLGFSQGQVVGQLVGARSKAAFEELAEQLAVGRG